MVVLAVLTGLVTVALPGVASAAPPAVAVTPDTNLNQGQSVDVSANGLVPNVPGEFRECNTASPQPTMTVGGTQLPVSCNSPLRTFDPVSALGVARDLPFTVSTGTVGPPAAGTDSGGGNSLTDANGYPCPPTVAQQAAGAACAIDFVTSGGIQASQSITFNPTPPVTVGAQPAATALDGSTDTLYVVNSAIDLADAPGTVSVVNAATCSRVNTSDCSSAVATQEVGLQPLAVALDQSTHTLYVANSADDTVSVIDTTHCRTTDTSGCSSGSPAPTVAVGSYPDALAVDQATHTLYVANSGDGTVSVVDTTACNATAPCPSGPVPTAPVGPYPAALAVSGGTLYVANLGAGTVSVIGTAGCNATTPCPPGPFPTAAVGAGPDALAVDQATHTLYVANSGDVPGDVSVIDTTACNATTPCPADPASIQTVGSDPAALAVDRSTHTLYAANGGDTPGTVSVVDTTACNAILQACTGDPAPTQAVGVNPDAVAVDETTDTVYVANAQDDPGDVSVLVGPQPVEALPSFNCPNLVGLTIQWSGTWQIGTSSGTWSGPMTIDINGELGGTITATETTGPNQGAQDQGAWIGSVANDCSTLNWDAVFQTNGNIAGTGGTISVNPDHTFGLGTFSYDSISPITNQWFSGTGSATGSPVPTVSVTSEGNGTYNATVTGAGWASPVTAPPAPVSRITLSDGTSSCTTPSLRASWWIGSGTCTIPGENAGGTYTITASYPGDTSPAYAPATATFHLATSNGVSTSINDGSDGVNATATGGNAGADTLTEIGYGVDPVPNLNGGDDYFDVATSPGSTFSTVNLKYCNTQVVTGASILWWWNTDAAGGAAWQQVSGSTSLSDQPEPSYPTVNNVPCVQYTLDASSTPTPAELKGTVFGAVAGRAIVSANSADARAGSPFSLTVTTTGAPVPSIKALGKLPSGVHLVDNHNGTATISGTPGATSGGLYRPTIIATYVSGLTRQAVTQVLTLFDFQSPAITSKATGLASAGSPFTFTVKSRGYPPPTVSGSGVPGGMTFTNNGDGTATLAGTPGPTTGGVHPLSLSAANGVGTPATQTFRLSISEAPAITSGTSASFAVGATSLFTVTATGYPAPTFTETGALPAGVTLGSKGLLSGRPGAGTAGVYPITVRATSKAGTTTQNFTLKVT